MCLARRLLPPLRCCLEYVRSLPGPPRWGPGSIVARASGTRRRNLRRRCRIARAPRRLHFGGGASIRVPARYPPIHPPKHHQKTRPNQVVRLIPPTTLAQAYHRVPIVRLWFLRLWLQLRQLIASAVPFICFPRQGRASQRVAVDQHPAPGARTRACQRATWKPVACTVPAITSCAVTRAGAGP